MKNFLLLLALTTASTAGCKPQVHNEPPEMVGERTNQRGVVTQRIVRETSYTSKDVLVTPEGPKKRIGYHIKWFLEEPHELRREFPLMGSVVDSSKPARCWPVQGTNQWLAAGT